ncbi:transcriptional regulator [Candidatus Magnetomorum sp. HK-1]|nr:transcriptional regulator [Candidatus Magnetomorum sp. HK-1]
MTNNKEISTRIKRLIQIVQEIKTNPSQTPEQVYQKFSISKAQFYKDKKSLSAIGVDFFYNRKAQRFEITRDAYIPVNHLSISERLCLILSMRQLSASGDYLLTVEGLNAARKLAADLPGPLRENAIMLFDTLVLKEGFGCKQSVMEKLQQSIMENRRINIDYQKPDKQILNNQIVDPYIIFFKRRALYMEGLSLSERGVRMFRINRINAIRMTGEKFTRDSSYDFTQRHKNAFSVFAGDKTEKVVVRFNKAVETYIQETLWHNSQSISTTKNGILFTVHVAEPKEVLWWALGWGASAEIIEPHWLRQMARDEIKQMLKKYK